MEQTEGVSICITAYKATRFIKECLDSIERQSWFRTHDNYEILVGVDDDTETLEYLRGIMSQYKHIRVFMMNSNEGTYITMNTLMQLAQYEYVVRFDADDIMYGDCILEAMKQIFNSDFVRFKFRNFYETDKVTWPEILIAHAIGMFRKSRILKFGGFRPWRIAADTDILNRTKGFIRFSMTENVVFDRRVYDGSLTTSDKTKQNSQIRNYYSHFIKNTRYSTAMSAIIQCVTNQYYEVFPKE